MARAHALALLLCAATASAEIAVTRTADELAAALQRGAEHILIASHLDLRELPVQTAAGGQQLLFVVPKTVQSITANCTDPPPAGWSVAALVPPQCVLRAESTVFRFNDEKNTVWLDSLNLQAGPFTSQNGPTMLEFRGPLSDVWITDTTIQGLGGNVTGIETAGTRSYVGGSAFRGLRRGQWPAFWLQDDHTYATAAFQDCLFENNFAFEPIDYGCSKIPAGIVGIQSTAACSIPGGATFRNCTFRNNGGAADVERRKDYVFSDKPLYVASDDSADCETEAYGYGDYEPVTEDYGDDCDPTSAGSTLKSAVEEWPAGSLCRIRTAELYDEADFACDVLTKDFPRANGSEPLSELGQPGPPWGPEDFLSEDSQGLYQIQQRSPAAMVALGLAEAEADRAVVTSDDDGRDTPVGAVVGAVLGALALLVLAGVALFALRRRRAREAARKADTEADPTASAKLHAYTMPMLAADKGAHAHNDVLSAGALSATTERYSHRSGAGNSSSLQRSLLADSTQDSRQRSSARPDSSPQGAQSTATAAYTADVTETDLERVRGSSVATAADSEELESVLDALFDARERFAGRFWLHNHFFRRSGGQGIVQFVQRCQDGAELAVKFFLARGAFERELGYYQSAKLRDILVPVVHFDGNQNGTVRSSSGYAFPPFIVVERGESLNEWVSRVAADVPTTIFVLLHLAEKLEKLHASGLCHRDLKPANVLWRPTANVWTLMDFGCAAAIGERAHLAFSVHYAAPEVILADEAGAPLMVVDASIDMWALGVIAVELLSGRRVFAPPMSESEARDQLAGRAPLPWEDERTRDAVHASLKALRRSVLKCLDRDPAQRPTSRELLGSWNGLFESMTGATTATYKVPEKRPPPENRGA